MAWIEAHQELADHPKIYKLGKLLRIDDENAPIGLLLRLWWWAMDYAPDGSLERYDADDLARATHWKGEPEELLEALIGAGWIDRGPEGLQIHDWYQYAGRLMEQREIKREQGRARQQRFKERHQKPAPDGAPEEAPEDNAEITRYSRVSNAPTVPNSTEQNTTKPEKEKPAAAGAERPAPCPYEEIVTAFNMICSSFPEVKKITDGRKKAIAARWREVGSLDPFREIFRAAEASPFLKGSNDRGWRADFDWILKPANWTKIAEGNYRDRGKDRGAAADRLPEKKAAVTNYAAGFKE